METVAADPRPKVHVERPGGRKGNRRRRTIAVLVGLALVIAGGVFWKTYHFGGDPGGSILESLRLEVRAAVPAGSRVVATHSIDAKWDSNGCDGSTGWTALTYDLTFRSNTAPASVIDHANHALTKDGWKRFPVRGSPGIDEIWIKTSSVSGSIGLVGGSTMPTGEWRIGGDVPPQGREVQGC